MISVTGLWFILYALFIRINNKNENSRLTKGISATVITLFMPTYEAAAIFLIAAILFLILPKKAENKYLWYLITLLLLFPSLLSFIEEILAGHANPLHAAGLQILNYIFIFDALNSIMEARQWLLILAGYLFTIRESTLLIRKVLDAIPAVPRKKESAQTEKDEDEYNRGRLIGILERSFIYFLIIAGQYASIAVILALKSLARFKELNDRNFAEYFLIGSFLSLLFAVIPAIVVKILI